jgi:CubicO group peptidase (beta-lactamase class C family)
MRDREGLQQLLDAALRATGAVGAQLSVFDRDGVTSVASGAALAATGRPMRVDTSMQVGSIAKVLTAVLIHQLVDEGLLDLDRPVREILPGFRVADDEATRTLAPRHLLSMTSGLDFGYYRDLGWGDDAVARFVDTMATAPSMFAPGEAFGYSGLGTVISSRIVQELRGAPWERVLGERVLAPLGMTSTSLDRDDLPYLDTAPGHAIDDGRATVSRPWIQWRATAANGTSILSSAHDLALFARSLAGGGPQVLGAAGLERLAEPVVPVGAHLVAETFCLGAYRRDVATSRGPLTVMGHGGRWAAGVCDVVWVPSTGAGFAIATNTPQRAGALIMDLYDTLMPEVVDPDALPALVTTPETDLDRYAGEFRSPTGVVTVTVEGPQLRIAVRRAPDPDNLFSLGDADLLVHSVGDGRFMPDEPGLDERRLQEVWFDRDAEYVYDGFVGARRTRAR